MDTGKAIFRGLSAVVGAKQAARLLAQTPVGDAARLAIQASSVFTKDVEVDAWRDSEIGSSEAWHREHCHFLDLATPSAAGGQRGLGPGAEPPAPVRRDALPPPRPGVARLVVVSDTHEMHRQLGELPHGDVFVHCGDIGWLSTFRSTESQRTVLADFNEWLAAVPCNDKVVIAGNHDVLLAKLEPAGARSLLSNAHYLENEAVVAGGLQFLGCSSSVPGARTSPNRAFQGKAAAQRAAAVADQWAAAGASSGSLGAMVDVLVTHGPCPKLAGRVRGRLHLWGHYHAAHGALLGRTISREVTGRDSIQSIREREHSAAKSERRARVVAAEGRTGGEEGEEDEGLASLCCSIIQDGSLPGGVAPRNLPFVVDLLALPNTTVAAASISAKL